VTFPTFDITLFRAQYPMYASIPDAVLENLWIEVDEVGTPIVSTLPVDKQLHYYYVVEAHLAELWSRGPGAGGIVTDAEQGTVSSKFYIDESNALIWWNQTAWGAKIAYIIKMHGGFQSINTCQNFGSVFGGCYGGSLFY
jgi:hypothetical protein